MSLVQITQFFASLVTTNGMDWVAEIGSGSHDVSKSFCLCTHWRKWDYCLEVRAGLGCYKLGSCIYTR